MQVWLVLGLGCFGSPVAQEEEAEDPRGAAPFTPLEPSPAAELGADAGLFRPVVSGAEQAEIDALESLGYTEGEAEVPARVGVVLHDATKTAPGRNLWCSGHGPEAYLTELDGTVVHRWKRSWAEAFGDAPVRGKARGTRYWRRVELVGDRGLLALFEGHGLIRLDRDSRIQWALQERVHHDLELLGDGSMLVLARKSGVVQDIHPTRPVVDDRILTVSAAGEVTRTVSLLSAFRSSRYAEWMAGRTRGDLFHTNSLHRLRGPVPGIPGTREGQVLVSFRAIHTVAVVDLDAGTVVWAARGPWRGQHDAQFLADGTLLLFDNFGAAEGHASAVRIVDPATLEAVWTYEGTPEAPFYSPFMGTVQILGNGNRLVSDGWVGRAFEVTPGGQLVWEFLNPHRITDERGQAFIAVVPQMTRIP